MLRTFICLIAFMLSFPVLAVTMHLTIRTDPAGKPVVTDLLAVEFKEIPGAVLTQELMDTSGIFTREYTISGYSIGIAAWNEKSMIKFDIAKNQLVSQPTDISTIGISLKDSKHKQHERSDFVYFTDKKDNFIYTELKPNDNSGKRFIVELRPAK